MMIFLRVTVTRKTKNRRKQDCGHASRLRFLQIVAFIYVHTIDINLLEGECSRRHMVENSEESRIGATRAG